ncbi:hypothetical protein [Clostridium sp.]|uniref:hypothetical protein n=1 Tax=Clostridium sp. TaxID=1506 RepID=UPI002FCAB744
MKKKVSFIISTIIIIALGSTFLMSKANDGAKTIEEAITAPVSIPVNIIHEEKTSKGSIVFCSTLGGDGLYTAVVKKDISGFKMVHSGGGDISSPVDKFGISYSYFPSIEKTSLPIYFGLIGDPQISEVKIVEKRSLLEEEAKIVNAEGNRLWLANMNKFKGLDFEIIGLSADGKELTRINDNISVYYAEEKLLENRYK